MLKKCRDKVFTPERLKSAFERTGIWPFNRYRTEPMKRLLKERQEPPQTPEPPSKSPSPSTYPTPKKNRKIVDHAWAFIASGNTDGALDALDHIEHLIEGLEYMQSKSDLLEDEQARHALLVAERKAKSSSRARFGQARAYRGVDIKAMLPAYLEKQVEAKKKQEQLAAQQLANGGRGGRGIRGGRGARGRGRGNGPARGSTHASTSRTRGELDAVAMVGASEEASEESDEDNPETIEDDQDNVPLGAPVGRDFTPAPRRSVSPEDLSWMSVVRQGKWKRAPPRRYGDE